LRPSAKQATGRKNAGKRQHPRDGDERSEKISTRDHEEGTRTQDGELGEQQNGCDRVNDEHRGGISRDEGVDPRQLGGRERPGRDEKGDQQGQHNGKREPSLRPAGRQAREDEMLFLWDNAARVHHRSDSSQRLNVRNKARDAQPRFGVVSPEVSTIMRKVPRGATTASHDFHARMRGTSLQRAPVRIT
jgi:hypothetical protein